MNDNNPEFLRMQIFTIPQRIKDKVKQHVLQLQFYKLHPCVLIHAEELKIIQGVFENKYKIMLKKAN